jgi:hypothetical protein
MNLAQLDKLIKSLNPKTDKDLIIFYTKKRKDLTKTISSKINKDLKSNKYGKGGGLDENGIDLFEDYENIPKKVQTILDKYAENYGDDFGDMDYKDMADMHDEVYAVGYTFESGLDNQPYDLRPIGTKGKSEFEQFGKGGGLDEKIKVKDVVTIKADKIHNIKGGYYQVTMIDNEENKISLSMYDSVIVDGKRRTSKPEEDLMLDLDYFYKNISKLKNGKNLEVNDYFVIINHEILPKGHYIVTSLNYAKDKIEFINIIHLSGNIKHNTRILDLRTFEKYVEDGDIKMFPKDSVEDNNKFYKYAKGGYVFKGDKYVYVPKEFIYTIGNL